MRILGYRNRRKHDGTDLLSSAILQLLTAFQWTAPTRGVYWHHESRSHVLSHLFDSARKSRVLFLNDYIKSTTNCHSCFFSIAYQSIRSLLYIVLSFYGAGTQLAFSRSRYTASACACALTIFDNVHERASLSAIARTAAHLSSLFLTLYIAWCNAASLSARALNINIGVSIAASRFCSAANGRPASSYYGEMPQGEVGPYRLCIAS